MNTSFTVCDASILINFLRINRIDLIGSHPDIFVVANHVMSEITDPVQRSCYNNALSANHIMEWNVNDSTEVNMFFRLARYQSLGFGERSAIAVALTRHFRLAIDDNRAVKRVVQDAQLSDRPISITRTQDIVVELIRRQILTMVNADAILADWARNRRLKRNISFFEELL